MCWSGKVSRQASSASPPRPPCPAGSLLQCQSLLRFLVNEMSPCHSREKCLLATLGLLCPRHHALDFVPPTTQNSSRGGHFPTSLGRAWTSAEPRPHAVLPFHFFPTGSQWGPVSACVRSLWHCHRLPHTRWLKITRLPCHVAPQKVPP